MARATVAAVPGYLVFFVAGPVDDALAAEIRRDLTALARGRAWSGPAPGFFDEPAAAPGSPRTTGGFLRVQAPADGDVAAVYDAVLALSARLELTCEVQWDEAVVGHVRAGVPDPGLGEALTSATASG